MKQFKLSNELYDVLKWTLLILAPASITLISTLGHILNYDVATINAIIGAVVTFAGSLIGLSSANYKPDTPAKPQKGYDPAHDDSIRGGE